MYGENRNKPESRLGHNALDSKGGLVLGRLAVDDAGGGGRRSLLVPNIGDFGSSAFAVDSFDGRGSHAATTCDVIDTSSKLAVATSRAK